MKLNKWIYAGIALLAFTSNAQANDRCQTNLESISGSDGVFGYRQQIDVKVGVLCQGAWSKASIAIATFRGKRVSKPAIHLSGFSTYPIINSGDNQHQDSFPFSIYRDGVYIIRVEAMLKDNPTFDDFDKAAAVEFYAFARDGYVTYSLDSPKDARLKHDAADENGRRSIESNIANTMGATYVPSNDEEASPRQQRHDIRSQQRQTEDDLKHGRESVRDRREKAEAELERRRNSEN